MCAAGSQGQRRADKISDMRKLVAILLLSLIPLQVSWSAVASYCQHEQGASARHFGHHEHQHEAHKAAQSGGVLADTDCSLCQAGFLTALMIEPALSVATPTVTGISEPVDSSHASAPIELPDRPNWS